MNPHKENDSWIIKVRITRKSEKKEYESRKDKTKGLVFNIDLVDENNDEITCTFFNEEVQKFYNILVVERVYSFEKCNIRNSNP